MVVRQQKRLEKTERTPGEIEENVANAPSEGALPPVVHEGLREVLDECDEELDIGAQVEELEPVDHRRQRHDHGDGEEDEDTEDDKLAKPRNGLICSL